MAAHNTPRGRSGILAQLCFQVLVGTLLGLVVGWLAPGAGSAMKPLGDAFIKLIRMMIGPVIFVTVVHGITRVSDMRSVGWIALKSLIYFEVITTVVVDHMGRPDVSQPIDGPAFQRFVQLLAEHDNVWTKVSCPERLSRSGPPGYDDVVPFARHLVERFPDRVLWGPTGRTRT